MGFTLTNDAKYNVWLRRLGWYSVIVRPGQSVTRDAPGVYSVHKYQWDGEILQTIVIPDPAGALPDAFGAPPDYGNYPPEAPGPVPVRLGIKGDYAAIVVGKSKWEVCIETGKSLSLCVTAFPNSKEEN
jgi:hypothetical protein